MNQRLLFFPQNIPLIHKTFVENVCYLEETCSPSLLGRFLKSSFDSSNFIAELETLQPQIFAVCSIAQPLIIIKYLGGQSTLSPNK